MRVGACGGLRCRGLLYGRLGPESGEEVGEEGSVGRHSGVWRLPTRARARSLVVHV